MFEGLENLKNSVNLIFAKFVSTLCVWHGYANWYLKAVLKFHKYICVPVVLKVLSVMWFVFDCSGKMTDRKAVIKNADMSEDMQQDAVDCATQALEKYNIEKDIAAYIKKEFDKKYNPTWHCIVGRNFGSYVTHETKHFIYFYLGQVAILLFKSG